MEIVESYIVEWKLRNHHNPSSTCLIVTVMVVRLCSCFARHGAETGSGPPPPLTCLKGRNRKCHCSKTSEILDSEVEVACRQRPAAGGGLAAQMMATPTREWSTNPGPIEMAIYQKIQKQQEQPHKELEGVSEAAAAENAADGGCGFTRNPSGQPPDARGVHGCLAEHSRPSRATWQAIQNNCTHCMTRIAR